MWTCVYSKHGWIPCQQSFIPRQWSKILSFERKKKNDPIINNVKLDCQMKDSNDYVIEGQIMVSGWGGEILKARMR